MSPSIAASESSSTCVEAGLREQRAHARDQRIDVLLLVAGRGVGGQVGQHRRGRSLQLAATALLELRGDVMHVVAAIAVGRKRQRFTAVLQVAQPGARA